MLYTRKGDNGTTKTFDAKPGERISKSSCQTEALGALDELNSFIGYVKVKSDHVDVSVEVEPTVSKTYKEVIEWVQGNLFIIQAETAGAGKTISRDKIERLEHTIDWIEREMPPIKTFFISGGTELASLMDISRTLARKAERRVIAGVEEGKVKVGADTLAFLNRLSSLFYAVARLINHKSGIKESAPTYE